MKKGAIFDMDGLLFDTERLYKESGEEAAVRFGQAVNPAFAPALSGTSGERSLDMIRLHYPAVEPEAFLTEIIEGVNRRLREAVPKKPGVDALLAYLYENRVKIAVASSSLLSMVQDNLRRAGIAGYFSVITSGQEVEHGKPEPDIFLLAAEQLGLSPEDCYVFEDSINGVRAGLAAGCTAVMVPDLVQPDAGLRGRCAAVCGSLVEVRERIEKGLL